MEKATILEIQRMSTEDGPGIRTTVFFKGCSLRCTWCHNPESISRRPQTQWLDNRCIGCHICLETCSRNCLSLSEQGEIIIERERCEGCGECVEECPSTALELLGTSWELDNLVREVTKDKAYFDTSGGGVTISGGEPALQSTFAGKFLKALKGRGIQTAFDTCGFYPQKLLERILRYSTVVLFDLKVINSAEHQRLTGHSNETILSNLVYISEFMKTHVHPKTLWIRTPIIPGATDSDENIRDIGRFLSEQVGHSADRWELCAFNNLCKDKYSRLGLNWEFENSELLEEKDMERLASIARASGVDPGIVHWSGSTRIKQATPAPPIDEHPLRSSG